MPGELQETFQIYHHYQVALRLQIYHNYQVALHLQIYHHYQVDLRQQICVSKVVCQVC